MDIKRGDIWYIESGYSVGSEQRAGRPAIVVSNNRNNQYSGTVEVVYLTTQPKRDLPTHVTISSLSRESTALCEQITSVSTERFGSYRGAVTAEEMEDIEEAMMISLGLAPHAAAEPRDETPPCWKPALLNPKPGVRSWVVSRVMRKFDLALAEIYFRGRVHAPWLPSSGQGAKGQGRRYAARLALDAL